MGDFLYICIMEKTLKQELNDTCLYMHTRKSDGRIFYIGIGNKRRPYRTDSRSKHWHNVAKKHKYDVTILADNLTWSRACELEKLMILFYGRKDTVGGPLVNICDGGDGQKNPSEETRRKLRKCAEGKRPPSRKGQKQSEDSKIRMSESKKNMSDETKRKIGQSQIGKKHSNETKQKMSNSHKGRTFTEETKKKISETNKLTYSREDIKKKISDRHKGKTLTDETKKKISQSQKGKILGEEHKKKISKSLMYGNAYQAKIVMDINSGVFYSCAKEAADVYGVKPATLNTWLNGKRTNKTSLRYV